MLSCTFEHSQYAKSKANYNIDKPFLEKTESDNFGTGAKVQFPIHYVNTYPLLFFAYQISHNFHKSNKNQLTTFSVE